MHLVGARHRRSGNGEDRHTDEPFLVFAWGGGERADGRDHVVVAGVQAINDIPSELAQPAQADRRHTHLVLLNGGHHHSVASLCPSPSVAMHLPHRDGDHIGAE